MSATLQGLLGTSHSQDERLTFCAVGLATSPIFLRGVAPLHPAQWLWGPAPSTGGIERRGEAKNEAKFAGADEGYTPH